MNPETEPPPYRSEPVHKGHLQWFPALGAGLIAGAVLLIVPRASPWSSLTFAAPVIMGRVVPEQLGMLLTATKTLHLAVSVLYGLIISVAVMRITQLWALAAGALTGLLLYVGNVAVVSTWFPELRGDEPTVAFSHLVFGGIAAGAYRGLLRRKIDPVRDE
jgi:hypothetical protein